MAVRKETIKKQFQDALPAVLEPGEQVVAATYCVSGPSPLWVTGLLGVLGMLLFGVRYYYLAVTDRRVVVMRASFWTSRPAGLAFADPRGSVTISDIDADAKLWNHLLFGRPGHKPLRLNVHAWWREEMKQVVAALGDSQVAPPGTPPPPPPPPGA